MQQSHLWPAGRLRRWSIKECQCNFRFGWLKHGIKEIAADFQSLLLCLFFEFLSPLLCLVVRTEGSEWPDKSGCGVFSMGELDDKVVWFWQILDQRLKADLTTVHMFKSFIEVDGFVRSPMEAEVKSIGEDDECPAILRACQCVVMQLSVQILDLKVRFRFC